MQILRISLPASISLSSKLLVDTLLLRRASLSSLCPPEFPAGRNSKFVAAVTLHADDRLDKDKSWPAVSS